MQALDHVTEAMRIIELADQRALASDGPVGHVRDEMSDSEWRKMYRAISKAEQALQQFRRVTDGTSAEKVGN